MLKNKIAAITLSVMTAASALAQPVNAAQSALTPETDTENRAVVSEQPKKDIQKAAKVQAPPPPEVASAKVTSEGLEVRWESVPSADGYFLVRYNPSAASNQYKYYFLYQGQNSFVWEDYSKFKDGYSYYIISFALDGEEKVRGEINDFTDMITADTEEPEKTDEPDSPDTAPAKAKITKGVAYADSVRLYWETQDCGGYEVYVYQNGGWVLAGVPGAKTDNLLVGGRAPSTRYAFRVRAFNYDKGGKAVYGEYSDTAYYTTKASAPEVKAPGTVTFKPANKAATAIRVKWDLISCDGYEIWMKKNGAWTSIGTAGAAADNFRISGLSPSTSYYFKVRAFNKNSDGGKVYGAFNTAKKYTTKASAEKTTPAPKKVKITKGGRAATAIRLYWEKQDCSGYEVYVYQNGGWVLAGVAGGASDNFRVNGRVPGTKYAFRVRAFNYDGNGKAVYGEYSDTAYYTTKSNPAPAVKAPGTVTFKAANKAATAIRVKWNKIDCDGYEVWMKKNGVWTSIGTVGAAADNFRISGLSPSTSYYFKMRAFNKKSDGGKVYGAFNSAKRYTTKASASSPNAPVYKNGAYYIGNVLIVNKSYPLSKNYNPGGLTSETQSAFTRLQNAAAKDGLTLWNASGFRSYETQKYLYDNYVYRDGKAAADRYSARPGHSEHQSGLALDVNNPSSSFDNTREAKWLAAHCADYGFILRYPKGKESVTGYMYESWHIRYVGKTLAKAITNSGLTMEEYYGIDSKYND